MAQARQKKRSRPPIAKPPRGAGTLRLGLVLAVLVAINLYVFLWRDGTSIPKVMDQAALAGSPPTTAENGGLLTATFERLDALLNDGDVPEQADEEGRLLEGQVQTGDSLGRILKREGLTPPEADEVIRALQEHLDFRTIRVGQEYRLKLDDDGRVEWFEFIVSRTESVRAEREEDGGLQAHKLEAHTDVRVHGVGGRIDSSLYAAIKEANEDISLVAFFVDVFAYDLNFYTDQHKGDTFRIVVEKEYLGDEFLGYRRVLAAEFSGRAGTYRAFRWRQPGDDEDKYFDESGRAVEKSLLKTPLKYARVSSRFNPNRMHPVLHRRRGHMGVDYAAPVGTPVWAAAPGRIVGRSFMGGAGNCVILKHDNGMQTVYMHLSKFRQGQRVGERVKGKTVIGYVGTTGLSTGPHLHFGVKQNGRYVDPMKLKLSPGKPVAAKHRPAFEADIADLVLRLGVVELPSVGGPAVATGELPSPGPSIMTSVLGAVGVDVAAAAASE